MWRFGVVLVVGAATVFGQTPAASPLNEGIAAFKAARYAAAIELFQQATNASPSDPVPHLYLATAQIQQFIPGLDTAENQQRAAIAERELQTVLALQPDNSVAMESLAALHFNRAAGKREMAEKMRALDEAAYWYQKILSARQDHKIAHYSLGVIAWSKFYPELMQARAKLGMRPEDPGPLSDPGVRAELRSRMGSVVEEGMRQLERALEIDPAYDDAMAYLNLLYRERGDLADSTADYQRDVQMADSLVQRTLEIKKEKAQQSAQNGGAGTARLGAVGFSTFLVAPPPPPGGAQHGERPMLPSQIRVGGAIQASKLIEQVQPEYPPLALQARIQGVVRLNAVVLKDGTVGSLSVVSGHPLMVPAAQEAVRRYRYQPTLLNGVPVEVVTQVDVNFNLP